MASPKITIALLFAFAVVAATLELLVEPPTFFFNVLCLTAPQVPPFDLPCRAANDGCTFKVAVES